MRIKEIRINKSIKQKKIAQDLNIPQNTFSQYENGHREPDNRTLVKIAEYLHVRVDDLLKTPVNIDNPTPPNQEESLTQKTRSELLQTLFDITKDFNEEQRLQVLDYAEYIKNRNKKE